MYPILYKILAATNFRHLSSSRFSIPGAEAMRISRAKRKEEVPFWIFGKVSKKFIKDVRIFEDLWEFG